MYTCMLSRMYTCMLSRMYTCMLIVYQVECTHVC